MREIIWAEDIIAILKMYYLTHKNEQELIIDIGSDLLDISQDSMLDVIYGEY